MDDAPLLDTLCRRAFDFFWNESDPETGLTRDRAENRPGVAESRTVASIAATGYALAALPVGAARGWVPRADARARAAATVDFLRRRMLHERGFFYHFVDMRDGRRVWDCELSSIDSALLALGALAAGRAFGGAVAEDADAVLARMDWPWMQNRGAADPEGIAPSMGWKPGSGFLEARWSGYTEALYLHVLALGSPKPLPRACWDALTFPEATVEGERVFGGPRPLFFAQMAPGWLDLRGRRDSRGRDWWGACAAAHRADIAFCRRLAPTFATFREGYWGVTACDQPPPVGYGAHEPREGSSDGTVAPTAMAAGALFVPEEAQKALTTLRARHGARLWGRYGFGNAFNVDKNWYDTDVVGIDLGMTLLCLENRRTGRVWKELGGHWAIRAGLRTAFPIEKPRI